MPTIANKYKQNVQLRVYNVNVLRYLYPEWDALRKKEKLQLIRNTGPEAIQRVQTHNVTCVNFHTYLARNINPELNASQSGEIMAFGSDDTSFSSSDESLNNKVGEISISDTQYDEASAESSFTGFVDSTEFNGSTLAEIGLYSDAGDLWNHAGISPNISKTSSETVVADIFITFSN